MSISARKASTENSGRSEAQKRTVANLRPFKPGRAGNPGGRPKLDVAAEIARAIFENNRDAAYQGLGKALLAGNAYVFKELADRAYGKMTEKLKLNDGLALADRIAAGRKRVAEKRD